MTSQNKQMVKEFRNVHVTVNANQEAHVKKKKAVLCNSQRHLRNTAAANDSWII